MSIESSMHYETSSFNVKKMFTMYLNYRCTSWTASTHNPITHEAGVVFFSSVMCVKRYYCRKNENWYFTEHKNCLTHFYSSFQYLHNSYPFKTKMNGVAKWANGLSAQVKNKQSIAQISSPRPSLGPTHHRINYCPPLRRYLLSSPHWSPQSESNEAWNFPTIS